MRIKGTVFSGFGRGEQLIEKWKGRISHLMGFTPFCGTLNVRLCSTIDMAPYSTISMDYVMLHGEKHVDARFAPVRLAFGGKEEACWAMRDTAKTHKDDVLEIVSAKNLKQAMGLKDGDEVEIELPEKAYKKTKVPGFDMVQRMMQKETRARV